MARPQKNTVTYFPLDCEDGKKMYYIEETYGNDGFATFIKILRELARSEYHYLNLSQPTTMMFLSSKCKVSRETLESIIKDLVELGKFNRLLWEENKVIWCQDFIDSIQDAYFKRKNKCITFEGLLLLLEGLGVRKPSKSKLKEPVKPQSKEEEIITDKNKENNINDRKLKFASTLEIYLPTYGKEMLNDFYKYWTEPNKSNTKFRQELEKTWSLDRRLETWSKNDKKIQKEKGSAQKEKEPAMIGRMTETVATNNFNKFLNAGKNE